MDVAGSVLTVGGAIIGAAAEDTTGEHINLGVWVRNQKGIVTTSGTARVSGATPATVGLQDHEPSEVLEEYRQR